ncbi:hypothetical protein BC939DRAFT_133089 [Gamsiella multidivaricata]|uniref:uncharacterized protein n=1 Tax=Gamsiella multidivaricata TaxID=101098 RepID=UPI00221EAFFA|nr:uncharacterized protein BC939DRAFT_133089 [Gamsiella multidivaricata]KAI7825220.1 hypothetical protein BC939DRAFT_133089 [Gamsiella multidivaricata]
MLQPSPPLSLSKLPIRRPGTKQAQKQIECRTHTLAIRASASAVVRPFSLVLRSWKMFPVSMVDMSNFSLLYRSSMSMVWTLTSIVTGVPSVLSLAVVAGLDSMVEVVFGVEGAVDCGCHFTVSERCLLWGESRWGQSGEGQGRREGGGGWRRRRWEGRGGREGGDQQHKVQCAM